MAESIFGETDDLVDAVLEDRVEEILFGGESAVDGAHADVGVVATSLRVASSPRSANSSRAASRTRCRLRSASLRSPPRHGLSITRPTLVTCLTYANKWIDSIHLGT